VRDVKDLARVMHEAFEIATSGRPGPVVVDIPKDVQFKKGSYIGPDQVRHRTYRPRVEADETAIHTAVRMMAAAKRPVFYSGGGIINSGPEASVLLRELVKLTGFPITSTLMGLGAFPASDPQWLGPIGMHGTYEANLSANRCDLLIALGSRFDDRVTGRVDGFSPGSKKIHLDIDPSQINKNIRVDLPIIADAAHALRAMIKAWKEAKLTADPGLPAWWKQIAEWRGKNSLQYKNSTKLIKPQYAIDRLYALTRGRESYITTEVGQHQMWAMQRFKFDEPNHWMTSGGLGTMGYGLPAAVGVQVAHPDALVIDIAGEASVQMTMQEMSTAVQYDLPIKIFILNNKYMGMVRQWQQLLHGGRYSHSYSEALPDFVKMADAFGAVGLRADKPDDLDAKIQEMIAVKRPVLFDVLVDPEENCYPMIPSGAAHDQMILSDVEKEPEVSDEGKMMV
jgi:acetolactate synthase-1/2/3 large subunit